MRPNTQTIAYEQNNSHGGLIVLCTLLIRALKAPARKTMRVEKAKQRRQGEPPNAHCGRVFQVLCNKTTLNTLPSRLELRIIINFIGNCLCLSVMLLFIKQAPGVLKG